MSLSHSLSVTHSDTHGDDVKFDDTNTEGVRLDSEGIVNDQDFLFVT